MGVNTIHITVEMEIALHAIFCHSITILVVFTHNFAPTHAITYTNVRICQELEQTTMETVASTGITGTILGPDRRLMI